MRIAYMLTSLGMGGAERHTLELAQWMAARGHAVLLFSLLQRQTMEWPTDLEVVRFKLRKTPNSIVSGLLDARSTMRRFAPDIVHSHTFPANLFARVLSLAGASPRPLSTMHNVFEGGAARMLAYRLTDSLALHVTAVSREVARRAIETRAVPAGKCTVIPNAIDAIQFAPDPARRVITRALHNAGDDFLWLAAGRITPAKDFPNLLAAFAQAANAHPHAQLWVAGQMPAGPKQKREFAGFSVPQSVHRRIHWLGLARDMPALFDAADGFVLSSAWEGMPLVIGEAMAMEKPIVATDVGGVCEILGKAGTLVPPHDSDALALAMLAIMHQPPEQRAIQGHLARQRILSRFDSSVLFPQWESFYRSLLA